MDTADRSNQAHIRMTTITKHIRGLMSDKPATHVISGVDVAHARVFSGTCGTPAPEQHKCTLKGIRCCSIGNSWCWWDSPAGAAMDPVGPLTNSDRGIHDEYPLGGSLPVLPPERFSPNHRVLHHTGGGRRRHLWPSGKLRSVEFSEVHHDMAKGFSGCVSWVSNTNHARTTTLIFMGRWSYSQHSSLGWMVQRNSRSTFPTMT